VSADDAIALGAAVLAAAALLRALLWPERD
jgi:hypothetical protein